VRNDPATWQRLALILSVSAITLYNPLVLFAQSTQPVPRIGLLGLSVEDHLKQSLLAGLRESGYPNVTIVDRGDLHDYAELLPAALDLVQQRVAVILAFGSRAPRDAFQATKTIPIVIIGGDPVAMGLARSHSRPGGNVTAVSARNLDLSGKQLELLREFVPKLKRLAVVLNPDSPDELTSLSTIKAQAQRVNVDVHPIEIRRPDDFEPAFDTAAKADSEALWIIPSTSFIAHRKRIAALALKYRMPSITRRSEYVESGTLVAYGPNLALLFRRAGNYAARILKGQSPAELPIDQAAEFELVVNETTAKALGLKIPETVRYRATIVQ